MGRLTGGVAHDFNNLLGVVSNSAHLIRRNDLAATHEAPVGAILRAVDVGHRLTQHLLRFAGRQPVRPQVLDLRAYLPTLHELMHTVLGSRIAFSAQAAPDTSGVMADSAELELALINLALNARDAMPQGGTVDLRARNATAAEREGLSSGDYVLITVADSGIGIDEDTAKRVFEPFFTTKGVSKGTGLGLSQVHGFCVQAGGAARLASTLGVGTTVSLLLPAGAAPPSTVAESISEPARTGHALTGRRVLLVEDNLDLGAVTVALLQSFDCAVCQVHDADQALRLLADDRAFDVVLSDVAMSGAMDGLALARELRRRWPRLPVVLISGFAGPPGDAAEFELLTKPCPPEALVAALLRAIAR
ncbi:MAG: response regulator [Burkholderiales bacterium]|nr:response regulator [Burkholderiales bacterium]